MIGRRLELHTFFVSMTNLIFSLIMVLLTLRVVFRLFAANSTAPFVSWLYGITDTLLYPLHNIFSTQVVSGRFILDITALVGLVLYALLLSIIIYLFDILFGVESTI